MRNGRSLLWPWRKSITQWWSRAFLDEAPSIGLSFFRIPVALTTGLYVIPTFFHLADNYLFPPLRTANTSFFTPAVVELIQRSPDVLVVSMAAIFCAAWFCFLLGLFSQVSCIIMTAGCYYFYGLNGFALGTLSWDILLVTLVLMAAAPYHGDYFSLDCLRRAGAARQPAYKRRRPVFLEQLLKMQIAFIYFYTGLYKITAAGNWLTDNPIYYLMHYPAAGVTKYFLLRAWLGAHPTLCYFIGISVVVAELAMPFLLFNPRSRLSGIYLGWLFHIILILTLDVPAVFFFLFPFQLLLFVPGEDLVRWIETKRDFYSKMKPARLTYDGHCQFCRFWVEKLAVMDLFGVLDFVDYHTVADPRALHPGLKRQALHSQIYLIDYSGGLHAGFFAARKLSRLLPMLYPAALLLYFPGSGLLGPSVYRWVANNRYLFHLNKTCRDNACLTTGQTKEGR